MNKKSQKYTRNVNIFYSLFRLFIIYYYRVLQFITNSMHRRQKKIEIIKINLKTCQKTLKRKVFQLTASWHDLKKIVLFCPSKKGTCSPNVKKTTKTGLEWATINYVDRVLKIFGPSSPPLIVTITTWAFVEL